MKKSLKTVSATLLSLMVSLSAVACSSNNGETQQKPQSTGEASPSPGKTTEAVASVYPENGLPKDQNVTLKVGFFEAGMGREWFDYAMDSFKKKFPNVSFKVTYSPKIADITGTLISANNDEDMFDLFSGGVPGGNNGITELVKAGKLEPQEDLWDRKAYDGNGKTLKELAVDGGFAGTIRFLGKTYALPISSTGSGLFINKNLFEQNGWNQNPKTWDEFLKLCEDIKAKGIIPITYPGVYSFYLEEALIGPWKAFEIAEAKGNLQQFEDIYRNLKQPYFTSPEYTELWKRVYDLGKKGYFPEGVAALNHTQSQMQVLQGKAAMVSTGDWVGNEMKESTPAGFKWGFMVIPMGDKPDSTKWMRLSSGNGSYIWAAKPNLQKRWAKEFNVWMWNLDIQQSIAEKGGQLPTRKDFMEDKSRADKLQDISKGMLEYMKQNKIKGETGFANVTLTDPAFAQSTKLVNESITQVTEGKKDPLPMLQEAEKLMKKAVDAQAK